MGKVHYINVVNGGCYITFCWKGQPTGVNDSSWPYKLEMTISNKNPLLREQEIIEWFEKDCDGEMTIESIYSPNYSRAAYELMFQHEGEMVAFKLRWE